MKEVEITYRITKKEFIIYCLKHFLSSKFYIISLSIFMLWGIYLEIIENDVLNFIYLFSKLFIIGLIFTLLQLLVYYFRVSNSNQSSNFNLENTWVFDIDLITRSNLIDSKVISWETIQSVTKKFKYLQIQTSTKETILVKFDGFSGEDLNNFKVMLKYHHIKSNL